MHSALCYINHYIFRLSFEDACFRFMKLRGFRPKTRFRSAVYIIMSEVGNEAASVFVTGAVQ
jgi:hypothetical protein